MKKTHFDNILVVNLGGMGDLLLSTPALRAIKNELKPRRLSILVVPRVYDLVKTFDYIDHVHILKDSASPIGVWGNLLTLLRLRQEHFDLAINMRTIVTRRSALMMKRLLWVINPAVTAGRDTDGRGSFFDIKINETTLGDKCEMDYDIDMANALGAKVNDRSVDLKVDTQSLERVKRRLEDSGVTPGKLFIGVHMAGKPSHRWPAKNYFEFIRRVGEKVEGVFLVTGKESSHDIPADLDKRVGSKIIDMTDKLDIKELTALISLCDLYVSNDTGPMHIAAALGIPLVAIFGPGYLTRFDPRNISDKAVVLYKKSDCAPCDKVICGSLKCLESVTPEEVVDKSMEILKAMKI